MNPILVIMVILSKARWILGAVVAVSAVAYVHSSITHQVGETAYEIAQTSLWALGVGGSASVLGMWVGRDKTKSPFFSIWMTVLIIAAVLVGMTQSMLDAEEMLGQQADLARIMETVQEIAIASGDEELAATLQERFDLVFEMPEDAGDTGMEEDGFGDFLDDAADVLEEAEDAIEDVVEDPTE